MDFMWIEVMKMNLNIRIDTDGSNHGNFDFDSYGEGRNIFYNLKKMKRWYCSKCKIGVSCC